MLSDNCILSYHLCGPLVSSVLLTIFCRIKAFPRLSIIQWEDYTRWKCVVDIYSLASQGYVCPGMLVLLTTESGVLVMKEAWYRHSLTSPPGYNILRLGISSGCSVTPFQQVSVRQFAFLLSQTSTFYRQKMF